MNPTVRIERIANNGCGVGKLPESGMTVFVPRTAAGDLVRVEIVREHSRYAEGKVSELLETSPEHILPDCAHFEECGGCCFRHLDYAAECRAKEQFVRDAFRRFLGEAEMLPILPSPRTEGYRNKAEFVFSPNGCGMLSERSHSVIDVSGCRLLSPAMDEARKKIADLPALRGLPVYERETGEGLLRHLILRQSQLTGELLACLVVNAESLPDEARLIAECRAACPEVTTLILNVNRRQSSVITGEDCRTLYGTGFIRDRLAGVPVELGALSFFQVNPSAAELLYRQAHEYASPRSGETIVDLYCGMGTIGLSMLPESGRLIGCEIIPEAVRSAEKNARAMGVRDAEFICGDAGRVASRLADRRTRPDILILDPPRRGCDERTLRSVLTMAPNRLVYVSCDPATVARDAALLAPAYTLCSIRPVDLFPRTRHVETVCLLVGVN